MAARFEKSRHEEEPFNDAATYVKRDKSKRSSSADYLTHLLNRLLNAVRTRNLTANDENGEEVVNNSQTHGNDQIAFHWTKKWTNRQAVYHKRTDEDLKDKNVMLLVKNYRNYGSC